MTRPHAKPGWMQRMALSTALRRADSSRDRGRYAQAAARYAVALAISPHRNDLRVQMGNMLKDSGQFEQAEAAYLGAIDADPTNADIHVQLGHVRKLTGRRGLALAAYRQALEIEPNLEAALRELSAAGEPDAQLAAFDSQIAGGGLEALLTIRSRLDEIADQLARIRERLPEALAATAFPIEAYTEFRRLFDVPAPLTVPAAMSFRIVLAMDETPLADLHAEVSAIRNQTHGDWRLILFGADPDRRAAAERFAAGDERIILHQGDGREETGPTELRLAASGDEDWVLFLGPGARAHPQLLAWTTASAQATACDAVIYDEEIEDPEGSVRPELRAPLDADTLIDANVWGETLAIRRSALVRLGVEATESPAHTRSQLLMALSAGAHVAHVPLPLTRSPARLWRSPVARTDLHGRAVRDRLGAGVGEAGSVGSVAIRYPVPGDTAAPIAVVIPSKDNLDDLIGFLRSLADLAARPDRLEILVVNNGSAASGAAIVGASGAAGPQVTVLDLPEPFNWSRFNNLAAARTASPLLLFANDDMLMEARNWDAVLRGFLERADIGAVGARLLYPDRTLQHAGVLFDWQGSTIHDGLHRSQHEPGPALRWHTTRHVSAVTGAFLATRRADFEAVGGFDSAHLAIAYSDVDFCLKLRALGRTILWTPAITAVHFESKSRGLDHLHAARMARDEAERAVIRSRWGEALDFEPSLNPHWFQATLPHRLLSYPSAKRIWSHIEASARPDPWRPRP